MHLADEMLDHFLRRLEVGNHAVAHGPDSFDMFRRAAQHLLGLVANRVHLALAAFMRNRDDGRFIKNNAPARHIYQRIGRTEIYGHVF